MVTFYFPPKYNCTELADSMVTLGDLCQDMATLPAGYIPQKSVISSSRSLGFIVCVQSCRMVNSVLIRHTISIL